MTANHAALLRRVAAETSDRELLARFGAARDGDAFAELVRRYGPAVFGVCMRVTRQRQDAEDAFQAVFVILARRADAIQKPELLGNWLYGVAVRVARKARRSAGRRRVRETTVAVMPEPAVDPLSPSDHGSVIDEELSALPEWYRDAVLLCDLYGHSRTEAATRLGIPEGTLSSRLAAGRKKLAERLARRGVTLAALVAVAVPAELANAAVASALHTVTGIPIETGIESLTHEGGRAMTKFLGWAGAAVVTLGLGLGAVLALPQPQPAPQSKQPAAPNDPAADDKPANEPPQKPAGTKAKLLRTIDISSRTVNPPFWSPDGVLIGVHLASRDNPILFFDAKTGIGVQSSWSGKFLGFGSSGEEAVSYFVKGGGINGMTKLLVTDITGRRIANPADPFQFGERVTVATDLERGDGRPTAVILGGKAVLVERVDMKTVPNQRGTFNFGGPQGGNNAFGGRGGPFNQQQTVDRYRYRVIDTATGEAGPDIITVPGGSIHVPYLVTPRGDRMIAASQGEKGVNVECFKLPSGERVWLTTIPSTPDANRSPYRLFLSGDGATLAVNHIQQPQPPDPDAGGPVNGSARRTFVTLLRMSDGKPGPEMPDFGRGEFADLNLSHDGRLLAAAIEDTRDKRMVQVWDLSTNKLLKSWNGSGTLAFSPKSYVLAILESVGESPQSSQAILGLWDLSPLVK